MDALDRIRTMIQESSLEGEYIDEFIYLLETANEEDIERIAQVFERDKTYLRLIYESYEKKKKAFESGSSEALQEVLEEEYRILKMLESDNDNDTDEILE